MFDVELETEDGTVTVLESFMIPEVEIEDGDGDNAVLFTGVSGPIGPQGERGERGPEGPAAVPSTVDIPSFVLLFENKLI
jgi:hypothetical protein